MQKLTINPDKIEELKQLDDDQEVLKELIHLYLPSTEEKLGRIADLLKEVNPPAIKQIAHEMRSSSGNLGADNLSELSSQLEYLPQDGEYVPNATIVLEKMKLEFTLVQKILSSYL